MEPTITPVPTPPPTPVTPPPPLHHKNNLLLIAGVVVLLLVVAGLSYYLGHLSTPPQQTACTLEAKICSDGSSVGRTGPNCEFSPCPQPSPQSALPADWIMKNSAACAVAVPLPPQKAPYIEQKDDLLWSWQFKEGMGRLFYELSFENSTSAQFFNDQGLGSGYVPGLVSVNCSQNTQNYTTTSFADSVSASVKKIDYVMGDKASCQPTQTTQTLWGTDVIVISTNCTIESGGKSTENYFVFANKDKVYFIEKISQSESQLVKDTTEKIFANLHFSP